MNDPTGDAPRSGPPPTPGERRLAHPPSDRYRTAEPSTSSDNRTTSPVRSTAVALAATVLGAAAITVLGGVLAVSAGLVVAAAATGWVVATAIRITSGDRIVRPRRVRVAIGLAIAAVALGQAGLWIYARSEGGVLGPLDYLGETFGPLVPLQFIAAWIVAWATAR